MKEKELQKHHFEAAKAFLLLADDDPTLAAEIATDWNEGLGHYNTPTQKRKMRESFEKACVAIQNGKVQVIPDGQPDIICRACNKKDRICGVK